MGVCRKKLNLNKICLLLKNNIISRSADNSDSTTIKT